MENEISNLYMVSIIEEKLPSTTKRKWAEEISKEDSHVNKRDPFPSLLKFLLQQRKVIEYISSDFRSKGNIIRTFDTNVTNNSQKTCWIHNSNAHSISV